MKCREYQELIIKSNENKMDDKEQSLLKEHLRGCKTCQQFESHFHTLHSEARALQSVSVPEPVDRSTHALCLEWLNRTRVPAKDPMQRWIFIIATALITLTMAFIILGYLQGYHENYPALETFFWLFFIQNCVMLILSPLLLRVQFRHLQVVRSSHHTQTSGQLFGLLF